MDIKEIFADGVGQIHFAGNMMRMDFVTLQPTGDGKAPKAEVTTRVIMPMQGFLGAFDSTQRFVNRLVAAGVLKKNEPKKEPAEAKK